MSASPSSAQPKQADVVASEASPEVISTQGLTEAGKAIQQHLKVDATNETDIITLLRAFEVRSVPDSITAGELMALVPTHSYTACFDVNFASQPSWVAHSPCQRCTAVNQLLHVVRHSQSSFTRSALGIALLVTQCDSERQRAGVVPKVPAEILERFLASFMNRVTACGKRKVGEAFHMSSNIRSGIRLHDSDAFVANLEEACVSLLHSSTFVRRAMNMYLSSHSSNIWPCERLPTKPTRRALTSKDLEHPNETLRRFACDALHWWYYLQDPISRCELPLAIPECKDTILQWDDTETRSVRFVIVIMDPDGEKLSWHPFGRTGLTGSAHRDVDDTTPGLAAQDACEVFVEALRQAPLPPRRAYLPSRLCTWNKTKAAKYHMVTAAIKMELPDREPKVWTFGNKAPAVPGQGYGAVGQNYPWDGFEDA